MNVLLLFRRPTGMWVFNYSHPSIHPWCYSAKSSLSASGQVNVWAAGDLARKMKRDWECFASIVECFFRCGSNPCLLCIVNWAFLRVSGTKEKWRCAHFFVSLYRVVTGAASACLIWRTHRHLLHTHFYTGDVLRPGRFLWSHCLKALKTLKT